MSLKRQVCVVVFVVDFVVVDDVVSLVVVHYTYSFLCFVCYLCRWELLNIVVSTLCR